MFRVWRKIMTKLRLWHSIKKNNKPVHNSLHASTISYDEQIRLNVLQQHKKINLAPPLVLSLGIVFLVFLGCILLKLPFATTTPISWLDSLFTAASAVTVTGLGVVDTGTVFTVFGQTVIALLIQFGGLGLMTFAVVTIIALGGKLGLLNQTIAKEAFNQTDTTTIYSTAKAVILFSFFVEFIGFIILMAYWLPDYGWQKSAFHSFFYVVSAFNNAGFALEHDNLIKFVQDPIVTITISLLIIIGGLGFSVWLDLVRKRKWSKLTVYSKMMITGTVFLNLIALAVIFVLEYTNPETLGKLSMLGKFLASWFQAISPRTAGFNTLDYAQIRDSTASLTLLLMFIGGGSLSTASGIKVVTFMILLLATISYIKRKEHVIIFQREIANETIHKAFTVTIISMAIAWLGIFLLTITEDAVFLDVIFEVISALGTVGLSRGLTPNLTDIGKITIITIMMIGRLGPLTFIYLFASPNKTKLRYVETKLPIG